MKSTPPRCMLRCLGLALWAGLCCFPAGFAADQASLQQYSALRGMVDEQIARRDYRGAATALEDFIKTCSDPKSAALARVDLGDLYTTGKNYYRAEKLYRDAQAALDKTEGGNIEAKLNAARREIVGLELVILHAALRDYYQTHARFPTGLDELGAPKSGQQLPLSDPWGHRYVYRLQTVTLLPSAPGADYILYSVGATGQETLGLLSRDETVRRLRADLARDTGADAQLETRFVLKSVYCRNDVYRAVVSSRGYLRETADVKAGDTLGEDILVEGVYPEGVVLSQRGAYGALTLTKK